MKPCIFHLLKRMLRQLTLFSLLIVEWWAVVRNESRKFKIVYKTFELRI